MVTNNKFKEATDTLVEMTMCLKNSLSDGNATKQDFTDMKDFIERHFDELNLSPLLCRLRNNDCQYEFNAYMALMNKYLGMSKALIPFQLNMKDYLLANKITGTLDKTYSNIHKNTTI